MQTFKHLLNTWLLALLAFPFFYTGYFLLMQNEADVSLIRFLYLFGFLFSLPPFVVCLGCLRFLITCEVSYVTRFMLWLLITAGSIIASAVLWILLLFDFHILAELFPFIVAAMVATWASVLMRFNQFIYFMHTKTKEYENDMV